MPVTLSWNNGSPLVIVRHCDLVTLKLKFEAHYGYKAGMIRKSRELMLSGHAAVEFLKWQQQPLGDFEGWVPKNDSRKYWRLPDTHFVDTAQKFRLRTDWKREVSGEYQHVHKKRPHLLEVCTAHMEKETGPFQQGYQIYAYEFSDNSVYVGLTCNPKRRHRDHQKRGHVAAKIKQGFSPTLKILAEGLKPRPATTAEQQAIQRYEQDDWKLLNREQGGSLGQVRAKYSYASVLSLARAAGSKLILLREHPAVFQAVIRYGWMPRLEQDLNWPQHVDRVWTYARCLKSARSHRFVSDWLVADKRAWAAAQRHGWLRRLRREHFRETKPVAVRWTQEACQHRARAFQTRSEWQHGCSDGSYVAARRKGWLKEIASSAFGLRRTRWSVVTA